MTKTLLETLWRDQGILVNMAAAHSNAQEWETLLGHLRLEYERQQVRDRRLDAQIAQQRHLNELVELQRQMERMRQAALDSRRMYTTTSGYTFSWYR